MSRDARPRRVSWLRVGFLADGVFKLLVASIYVVLLQVMTDFLDAPPWLLVATAALVATSGIAEITFALRSGAGSHTRYLVAYDSGWVIVTFIAALLAFNDVLGAGTFWLAYQLLASPLVAAVFAFGARRAQTD
ncbi:MULTISPECIES: hypothetical protein [unclassified Microbacterium]|uniref:hypothetical protein n=1 Tax=unclassified Microbacterium TaxID=2609290 RepID=UPI00068D7309|nr:MULTISPECIES: hypothetical protein [unclassified Microbacterium]